MADEVQEEEGGLRSQMWKHEAMVSWLNEQEGVDLDTLSAAEIIAYAFARRVEWRKSDTYRNLVASHATEAEAAREAKAAERAEAAAARKAAKEAEAAEKAAAKETDAAPSKAAAKKAAAAAKPVAKAAKATKKGTAASEDDSPFS